MLPHVWRICYIVNITYSLHGRISYRSGYHRDLVWLTLSNVDDIGIGSFIIPYCVIDVYLNN